MKYIVLLAVVAVATALSYKDRALTQEMIDRINNDPTSTWKAAWNNKFDDATLGDAMSLCGTIMSTRKPLALITEEAQAIPDEFDSRTNWPQCKKIIGWIRDQSTCGSCWAYGAVEAFEDRYCIASNGTKTPEMSTLDLLSCCGFSCGSGCNGGTLPAAWAFIQSHGVVTGGDFGDKEYCAPYPFPQCDHHVNGTLPPCGDTKPTPKCPTACQAGYPTPFAQDKHYVQSHAGISSSVAAIQTEIMAHGPIECAFTVYNDFLAYKSGVYHHTTGSALGGHAIKVMGWGVENGVAYWEVANSWNEDWGDKGTFKIRRGNNECGIEGQCHAGIPKMA